MGYGTQMIDKDFEPSGFIFFCGHHEYIIEAKHICIKNEFNFLPE